MIRMLGGSAELAQKVVRSTALANGRVTLIGFVAGEGDALVGHLLVETTDRRYRHVQFSSCDVEGGWPEILAVFFARTVKGGGRTQSVEGVQISVSDFTSGRRRHEGRQVSQTGRRREISAMPRDRWWLGRSLG